MITITKKSISISIIVLILLINISILGVNLYIYQHNLKIEKNLIEENIDNLRIEKEKLQLKFNSLEAEYNKISKENLTLKKDNNYLKQKITEVNKTLESYNEKKKQEYLHNLVNIKDTNKNIVIDIRYATENNFTGKKIYTKAVCLLSKSTAEKLTKANDEFMKNGYRLKIWDAYRPLRSQQVLYDAVDDKSFVADPSRGSRHNRGTAVDVTLVDKNGKELEMPTDLDDFTIKASRNYNRNTKEAQKNMEYLTSVMTKYGFTTINNEWWHFDDCNWRDYPLLDIPLDNF